MLASQAPRWLRSAAGRRGKYAITGPHSYDSTALAAPELYQRGYALSSGVKRESQ